MRKTTKMKKVNNYILSEIIKGYQLKESVGDMSKKFNISQNTIYRHLISNQIYIPRQLKKTNRLSRKGIYKYKIDDNYFDAIDTEDKAYFLGLLYADGTMHHKTKVISIGLIEKDKHILELLNKLTNNQCPLYPRPPQKDTHQFQNILVMRSDNMSEKLQQYGIVPNKTMKIRFPFWLNKSLWRHFIRGYFDGDGCICHIFPTNRADNFCVTFTCKNLEFCNGLLRALREDANINFGIPRLKHKNGCFELRTGKIKTISDFYKYIYTNASSYLYRKYNIFQSFLINYPNSENYKEKSPKTSKYKGISLYKPTRRWCARHRVNQKIYVIGWFDTEEEAKIAYDNNKIQEKTL